MNAPVSSSLSRRFIETVSRKALAAKLAASPGKAAAALAAGPDNATDVPLNLPAKITSWLANLSLLYGVPFEYLAADARLLPVESMRFFYLDPNWVRRAIDGALSLGASSTRDNVFNQTFYQDVYAAVAAQTPQVRQTVRGAAQPAVVTTGATVSGVLFRSAVVSGYPGLEVVPTLKGQPVPILRMDRLAGSILLVLFNGVPDHIDFRQPAEGLHFGITRASPQDTDFTLFPRWLGYSTDSDDIAGNQIYPNGGPPHGSPLTMTAPLRPATGGGQPGVIDIKTTVANLTSALGAARLNGHTITSAEFAVEMVLSAGVQSFDIHPATASPPA